MVDKMQINHFKETSILIRCKWAIVLLLFMSIYLLPISMYGQTSEYDVKVFLLLKISEYIEWPEQSEINDKSEPFVIGVIGENPFGTLLEDTYQKEKNKIKNKNVEIRYYTEPNQIGQCHILFISSAEKNRLADILSNTHGKSVLTLGDTKNFGENGVHINFYILKNKIRFELNESSITNEGFNVDYRLRNIAKIVGYRKGETH